jgi:hypothetical protein
MSVFFNVRPVFIFRFKLNLTLWKPVRYLNIHCITTFLHFLIGAPYIFILHWINTLYCIISGILTVEHLTTRVDFNNNTHHDGYDASYEQYIGTSMDDSFENLMNQRYTFTTQACFLLQNFPSLTTRSHIFPFKKI